MIILKKDVLWIKNLTTTFVSIGYLHLLWVSTLCITKGCHYRKIFVEKISKYIYILFSPFSSWWWHDIYTFFCTLLSFTWQCIMKLFIYHYICFHLIGFYFAYISVYFILRETPGLFLVFLNIKKVIKIKKMLQWVTEHRSFILHNRRKELENSPREEKDSILFLTLWTRCQATLEHSTQQGILFY